MQRLKWHFTIIAIMPLIYVASFTNRCKWYYGSVMVNRCKKKKQYAEYIDSFLCHLCYGLVQ